jgi:hypothetical protein
MYPSYADAVPKRAAAKTKKLLKKIGQKLAKSVRASLKNKIRCVVAVEQMLPLKDGFILAAGTRVVLTACSKCGLGKNSERVAACFFNH